MRLGYGIWLCCILLCGVVVAPAANARVDGTTLAISQELYSPDGNPLLVANSRPVGGQPIDWQRCHPRPDTCVLLPGTAASIDPGESLPGTVFTASISGVTAPEVLTSRTWAGKLTALTPPTISGTPAIGRLVRGVAGSWSGGWGNDRESVTVMACKRPTSPTCDVVTGSWQPGEQYLHRRISPEYLDWILYAVNHRLSSDEIFPAIRLGKTRENPLLHSVATTSISRAFGPVRQNRSYSVKIFKFGEFGRKSVALARTRCESACAFRATVRVRFRNRSNRTITKRLDNTDVLRIPVRRVRGSRSVIVTITDRGVKAAKRIVRLKRHSGFGTFVR